MQKYNKLDTPEIAEALFPVPAEPQSECPDFAQDIQIAMTDATNLVCRFYVSGKDAPTLLYFHGGSENISQYDTIAERYLKYGINLLLASYRGGVVSGDKPKVSAIMTDLPDLFGKLTDFLAAGEQSGPLFVMGKSLGSACAIELANDFSEQIKGMIIESGFCDTIPFLQGLGVDTANLAITEDDGFNNLKKIAEIKLPTLIFHGAKDSLVSPAEAETLQACAGARSKQFFIIPGAEHGKLIEAGGELYFQTIKSFVDTTSGVNTWRQRRKKYRKAKEE